MSTEQEQKELDDPLGTKIDAEREMGMAGGSNNQDLLMSQQEALMMLRDSINQTPEISPNQVLAAGALALAPAIGGYIAGKSVGNAYISPWLKPETILDMEMPGASSAAADALGTGVKEGDKYLAQLRAQSKQEADQEYKVGSLMLQQAGMEERNRASIKAANERARQGFEDRKNLELFKHNLKAGDGDSTKFPRLTSNPIARQAWDNIASGNGTREDFALLTPDEQMAATQAGSRMSYGNQVESLDNQRKRQVLTTQLGGDLVPVRPNAFDPKLDQERAKILSSKNQSTTAISAMIDSVSKHGVKFLSPEAFTQTGLASLGFAGARTLLNTGMQLQGKEQELVLALTAPNLDINGAANFLYSWVKAQGDYIGALQAIKNVLDLSYDSKLEGYGQTSRAYAERKGLKILDINSIPGMQGLTGASSIASPAPSGTPNPSVTPSPSVIPSPDDDQNSSLLTREDNDMINNALRNHGVIK